MYELKGGTKRLARALLDIAAEEPKIKQLAYYLNYQPEQLKQDIAALNDYIRETDISDT